MHLKKTLKKISNLMCRFVHFSNTMAFDKLIKDLNIKKKPKD